MPTIRTPDGRMWEFPEGMAESDMGAAIDAELAREQRPTPPQSGATGNLSVDIPRILGTAGVNAAAGIAGLPRLATQGVDWLGRQVGMDIGLDRAAARVPHPLNPDYPLLPDFETAKNAMMAGPGLSTGGTEYVPTTLAGRTGMAALTGGLTGGAAGAIGGISGGLPAALLQGAKAIPGGVGAGAGAQLGAEGAEAAGLPPMAGALLGGVLGDRLVTGAARVPFGPRAGTVKPETAELASMARDRYGVPVGGAQMSETPLVRKFEAMAAKFPFSPTARSLRDQQDAFNRAVAETMGEKTSRITARTINDAHARLGPKFDDFAKGETLRFIPDDGVALQGVLDDASMAVTSGEMTPILRQIQNVISKIAPNRTMSGEQYLALTRKGTPLDNAMRNGNSNISHAASRVRAILDDVLERSVAPEKVAELREARAQYKALKTIEPLTIRATDPEAIAKTIEGDINPSALRARVNQVYRFAARDEPGMNQLNDLANIGQRFLKEPRDSGTPLGTMVLNPLGGDWRTLASRAMVPIADRTLGSVMRSRPYVERLIQGGLSPAPEFPGASMLVRALLAEQAANSAAAAPALPQGRPR